MHPLAGDEAVIGVGDDVHDGIADGEHVEAAVGHGNSGFVRQAARLRGVDGPATLLRMATVAIVRPLRRYSVLAMTMVVAACSAPVERAPAPPQIPPSPVPPAQQGQLVGKTSAELIARFGQPALRIPEGSSLKLQFRAAECVLDAYLYPVGGTMRVTYVDTRLPFGRRL